MIEAISNKDWDSYGKEVPQSIKDIAQELLSDLKTMQKKLAWLTSREAFHANELGSELAEIDTKNLLVEQFPKFLNRGDNWLLLINYYTKKGLLLGNKWLNDWMLTYAEQNPEDHHLPLAVAMYGQGSDDKARFVMRSLSQGIEPKVFPWLCHYRWILVTILILRGSKTIY